MNIIDVRKALWDAYAKCSKYPDFEGKSAEARVDVIYPSFWECDTIEEFNEPIGIMVYSYSLGTSRSHYFWKKKADMSKNYYTWISDDIFGKAVEVINEWADEYINFLEA
jgi:hypothetical protein